MLLRRVFLMLAPALMLRAQSVPQGSAQFDEYLDALARTAATFAATAPGLTAEETLNQRGRRGFIEILRGKKDRNKDPDIKLPEEFNSHRVISTYALRELGAGHALHEVRTIVTLDGETPSADAGPRHALTLGLRSPDDGTKREMLEDLDHDQLEGAVTDFGPLILLFARSRQKDYEFSSGGEQDMSDARLGEPRAAEPVVVIRYRQISGGQGLTFFKERTEDRQPASGEIWFRMRDLLPVRITFNTEEPLSKRFTILTEATVDYASSPFGLVPESVRHRQLLNSGQLRSGFFNSSLMVENEFRYADYHHARPMIP